MAPRTTAIRIGNRLDAAIVDLLDIGRYGQLRRCFDGNADTSSLMEALTAAYTAANPDVTFEMEANANGTPSGNKQLVLFCKFSLDGTNYGSGPESGTTATEEGDLHFIGAMPTVDTNDHRKFFSLAGLPIARYLKLVVKNDLGVALTSGNVYKSDITIVST